MGHSRPGVSQDVIFQICRLGLTFRTQGCQSRRNMGLFEKAQAYIVQAKRKMETG